MKRYNHMFSVSFSLETENEDQFVTPQELMDALKRRVRDLQGTMSQEFPEIIEAVGAANDTYEIDMPEACKQAIEAFEAGDVRNGFAMVKDYIAQSGDLDKGFTSLHWACAYGVQVAVDRLLETGVDTNMATARGKTPLHYAAKAGNAQIAQMLIDAGADVNAVDDYKNTPLHLAGYLDHTDLGIALIKAGADPKLTNTSRETPFDFEGTGDLERWYKSELPSQEITQSIVNIKTTESPKTCRGMSL